MEHAQAHVQKSHTLFGGAQIKVVFADSREDDFKVRQFKVKEYQAAFRLIDDEIALVALACDKPRQVIEELTPESYELAHAKMREVNLAGFFEFAARTMKQNAANLAALPPATLEKVLANKFRSPTP